METIECRTYSIASLTYYAPWGDGKVEMIKGPAIKIRWNGTQKPGDWDPVDEAGGWDDELFCPNCHELLHEDDYWLDGDGCPVTYKDLPQ